MLLATSPRRYFVPAAHAHAGGGSAAQPHDLISRILAIAALALLLVFNVALGSFKFGGLPIRGVLAVGMLVLLAILYSREAGLAVRRHWLLLGFAAGLALEGTFVSLVNGASGGVIAESVTEVYLQSVITLLVAAILARIAGPRASAWVIIGVIAVSAAVAVLQMKGVHAAWNWRRALGPLSLDETDTFTFDRRPTGLSYSPIQLSTQLCLAFAAFAAVRDSRRQLKTGMKIGDPTIILGLLVFFAACVATATRSPILGGVIFLGAYVAVRRGSWVPLAVMFGGVLAYFAWPLVMGMIQENAPRVMETDDKSAAARFVFLNYGIWLFTDNPFGYGFTFEPSQMWTRYWPELYMMRGARGAQLHDLHNYVLSMLNIYGIGIFLFAPLAVRLLRRAGGTLLFFIPYMVQIMFHNSGPFYNDTIIWFVIGTLSASTVTAASGARRGSRNQHRIGQFGRGVRASRTQSRFPAAARTRGSPGPLPS